VKVSCFNAKASLPLNEEDNTFIKGGCEKEGWFTNVSKRERERGEKGRWWGWENVIVTGGGGWRWKGNPLAHRTKPGQKRAVWEIRSLFWKEMGPWRSFLLTREMEKRKEGRQKKDSSSMRRSKSESNVPAIQFIYKNGRRRVKERGH